MSDLRNTLLKAQLARRTHLLHQRGADTQNRNRPDGLNRGLALRTTNVTCLAETVAAAQVTQAIAVGLHGYGAGHDNVKAIVDLTFPHDIITVPILVPVRGTQNFPDFGV